MSDHKREKIQFIQHSDIFCSTRYPREKSQQREGTLGKHIRTDGTTGLAWAVLRGQRFGPRVVFVRVMINGARRGEEYVQQLAKDSTHVRESCLGGLANRPQQAAAAVVALSENRNRQLLTNLSPIPLILTDPPWLPALGRFPPDFVPPNCRPRPSPPPQSFSAAAG